MPCHDSNKCTLKIFFFSLFLPFSIKSMIFFLYYTIFFCFFYLIIYLNYLKRTIMLSFLFSLDYLKYITLVEHSIRDLNETGNVSTLD